MSECVKTITCFPGEPSFIFRWEKRVKPSSTHLCLSQSRLGVCGEMQLLLCLGGGNKGCQREGAVMLRAGGSPGLPGS